MKFVIFIFTFCFSIALSGAENRSINWDFYNYLALDLGDDILRIDVEGEQKDIVAHQLTERLDELRDQLAVYISTDDVSADFLIIDQLLKAMEAIVSHSDQQQPAAKSASFDTAVEHVRTHLKRYLPKLSNGETIQIATEAVFNPEGEWKLTDTVSSGLFAGLSIGFKLRLRKGEMTFEAEGEKYWENDRVLPVERRTPIQIYGLVINNVVHAVYSEKGLKNKSTGEFVWLVQNAGTLSGLFSSSVGARGVSRLTRIAPDSPG